MGPEEGKNLAQRPLELLCHFKKIASVGFSFAVYFGQGGQEGKEDGKEHLKDLAHLRREAHPQLSSISLYLSILTNTQCSSYYVSDTFL